MDNNNNPAAPVPPTDPVATPAATPVASAPQPGVVSPPNPVSAQPVIPPAAEPAKGSNMMLWVIMGILVVLIVVGGGGYWYMTQNAVKPTTNTSQTQVTTSDLQKELNDIPNDDDIEKEFSEVDSDLGTL